MKWIGKGKHFEDLFKNADEYISEGALNIHYATIQDSVKAKKIREYFRLGTLCKSNHC